MKKYSDIAEMLRLKRERDESREREAAALRHRDEMQRQLDKAQNELTQRMQSAGWSGSRALGEAMSRREKIVMAMNILAGFVYAVVYGEEIERLDKTTIQHMNGRAGIVLSWVPLEFRP